MLPKVVEEAKPKFYLPEVNNGPVTCQPLDINESPEVRKRNKERAAAVAAAKKTHRIAKAAHQRNSKRYKKKKKKRK